MTISIVHNYLLILAISVTTFPFCAESARALEFKQWSEETQSRPEARNPRWEKRLNQDKSVFELHNNSPRTENDDRGKRHNDRWDKRRDHDAQRNIQHDRNQHDGDRHDRDRHVRDRHNRDRFDRDRRDWNRHDRDRFDRDRHERDIIRIHDHRKPKWDRHPPRRVEHVYHRLPPKHDIFHHRGDRYHFHSGRYYRHTPQGFLLVRPPVGLIVMSLPLGFRTVISAGITYNVFDDVYYRRVPSGYQVVEPVRITDVGYPERVVVNADILNVRSGPDESEDVSAQISRGMTLRVMDSIPGWLFIEVEGEDIRGWVQERYTVNISGSRG